MTQNELTVLTQNGIIGQNSKIFRCGDIRWFLNTAVVKQKNYE